PELPLPTSSSTTIAIVATGCSPCRSGQVIAYRVDVTNPGPALRVEFRGGARLPDGSIISFVQSPATIPIGASSLRPAPPPPLPPRLAPLEGYVAAALPPP